MDRTADRQAVNAEARVISKALPHEIYQTVFCQHYYIIAPNSLFHTCIHSRVTNTITRLATDRVLNIKAKAQLSLSTA
jgi:hypothetical protein